jgi:hypothetical protein
MKNHDSLSGQICKYVLYTWTKSKKAGCEKKMQSWAVEIKKKYYYANLAHLISRGGKLIKAFYECR